MGKMSLTGLFFVVMGTAHAQVWQTENYIAVQAPDRIRCGGIKLVLKENMSYDPRTIKVIGVMYDSSHKNQPLLEKGSCLLSEFPAAGIAFDRPAYSSTIYYRIYFVVPKQESELLPVNDIIEKIVEIPAQLCLNRSLSYEPLNLQTRLTHAATVGLTTVAVLASGALIKKIYDATKKAQEVAQQAKESRQKRQLEQENKRMKEESEEVAGKQFERQAQELELQAKKAQEQEELARAERYNRNMVNPPLFPELPKKLYMLHPGVLETKIQLTTDYLVRYRNKRDCLENKLNKEGLTPEEQEQFDAYDTRARLYYSTIEEDYKQNMTSRFKVKKRDEPIPVQYYRLLDYHRQELLTCQAGQGSLKYMVSEDLSLEDSYGITQEAKNKVACDREAAALKGIQEGWELGKEYDERKRRDQDKKKHAPIHDD